MLSQPFVVVVVDVDVVVVVVVVVGGVVVVVVVVLLLQERLLLLTVWLPCAAGAASRRVLYSRLQRGCSSQGLEECSEYKGPRVVAPKATYTEGSYTLV